MRAILRLPSASTPPPPPLPRRRQGVPAEAHAARTKAIALRQRGVEGAPPTAHGAGAILITVRTYGHGVSRSAERAAQKYGIVWQTPHRDRIITTAVVAKPRGRLAGRECKPEKGHKNDFTDRVRLVPICR